MKKLTVAILALVYMTVSSGIAMEIHYCMGEKAGVELYGSSDDQCGKCGMKEKKAGCCHDEHKFYKLKDSHKSVSNDISLAANEVILLNDHQQYDWQLPAGAELVSVNNHSPPGYTGPSACIMNCVFRL
jgi:hypothetical protein